MNTRRSLVLAAGAALALGMLPGARAQQARVGMVAGSPGMEQGRPQPYATIAFDERGSLVFARH